MSRPQTDSQVAANLRASVKARAMEADYLCDYFADRNAGLSAEEARRNRTAPPDVEKTTAPLCHFVDILMTARDQRK